MGNAGARHGLETTGIDLGMLASDLAALLSEYHDLDVCSDDVRPVLPAFLAGVVASAVANEAGACGGG